jgi:hypothetical protein
LTLNGSQPIRLNDHNRSPDDTVVDAKRLRAEAATASQRLRTATLAEFGLTAADAALFAALYYGIAIPPSDLPARAAQEDYNPAGPTATEGECRVALARCLANGWVQVIDEAARTAIADDLKKSKVLGPIYGALPDLGCVDFTEVGAGLLRQLHARWPSSNEPVVYSTVVRRKVAHFFRTSAAADSAIQERCRRNEVAAIIGPTPIGPWRAQWWRRFLDGYRVDIQEQYRSPGPGSGDSESCNVDWILRNADSDRLRKVLDGHSVTFAEWLMLAGMEQSRSRNSASHLCCWAAELGNRLLGISASEEQYREALTNCLGRGWLRTADENTAAEIDALLREDPVFLALPNMTRHRSGSYCHEIEPQHAAGLTPAPRPASHGLDAIEFTSFGATLYRKISAEWLGPHWEDDLQVSHDYLWEEHHYSESEAGFQDVTKKHLAAGVRINTSRVVPIGPWCVYWWQRFPAGYRLELELGNDFC